MSTASVAPITTREQAEIDAANASGLQPVVFVHGLWLLPNSWADWQQHFSAAGYTTLTPGWPDDPKTTAEALANPGVFAGKSVQGITDHIAAIARRLDRAPILIGHSFGGLIVQKLAGMGLAAATVAIDPGPIKGVLPLPFSALKVASSVVLNPANYRRQVRLTKEQFRYGFGNRVTPAESDALYERYSVPGSGIPLFQASTANFRFGGETAADTTNPARGPLLVISGEFDHTVPRSIAHAVYRLQAKNPGETEFIEIAGRGHSLTIDAGWRDVADTALAFVSARVPA
ncbi:alpha/beta hydrolase [Microbacteriaceae bacterium VKM Ac-2855]|nr:alpha/beta hydrolase [Microbacteriaceae bacterium VKM Ac-2855]